MSSKRLSLLGTVLAGVVIGAGFSGCADFERGRSDAGASVPDGGAPVANDSGRDGEPASDGQGVDAAAKISFAATIDAILHARCGGCHVEGGMAGDTMFILSNDPVADDATVLALISVSDPSNSRLLQKAGGQGHQGGTVLAAGSSDYEQILQWIQQGAGP